MKEPKNPLKVTASEETAAPQKIIVFQQNGSGEKKIAGIREYGGNHFDLEIVSIDTPLPEVIDDPEAYLPRQIKADLVLDFLKHPDLSLELVEVCNQEKVPVVASGRKWRGKNILTPPT
jgi:hypothetical protein